MSVTLNRARHPNLKRTLRSIARNWDLYLLLVPVLAYFIIFHYAPMYGVQIAFRRYSIRKGILGSQWVGMAHFNRFFQSYYFERLLVQPGAGLPVAHPAGAAAERSDQPAL